MIIRSLLLYCFLFAFTSSSGANIELGSSLNASDTKQTWPSGNGTFFVGFTQVGATSYVAAVSYVGGVSIWIAGGASVTVDAGGALHLLSNGNLQLVNGSGTTIWNSNTANLGVTSASLDDSGNLMLKNGTGSVWSTFQNPTNTIVPSQNFTVNQILQSGSYSCSLLSSGNLTLAWNNSIVYWNQALHPSATNFSSPILVLQSNGILSLFNANSTTEVIVAYSNDYGEGSDILRFLRLDSDGNLRIYSADRGNRNTTVTWAALADQCQVYGYCGNMGICSYNGSNPICGCPSQNFEVIDVNDRSRGCKRKVELEDCAGNVTLLELKHTKFLTFQADQTFIIGITACRSNCLSGPCFASSSLADGSGFCYLKTTNFISGYQSPVLPSTSYVKVCGPAEPNPMPSMYQINQRKCWKQEVRIMGAMVLAALLCMAALVVGVWWRCWRHSPRYSGMWAQYTLLEYASGAPVQFSYKELHRLTKKFKEKLGEGGFGAVYKGILDNKTVVAVKQLEGIEQGEKHFRMEIATISSTHHLNLVRLIGFCSEGHHRLLVYEFMKHGSLDNFLFNTEGKLLSWEQRFNIALGTARGVTYLHEECRECIIHCDIKPENILLDENYHAKVSDFGLAKLMNPKDHRHQSLISVRGTRGYLAPEWLANLPTTSKSDVYSYGMVLLEIVSGRRNFEVSAKTNGKKFSVWACEEFEKGNMEAVVDERLANQDNVDMGQVMRAIQVAFWCIQEHPSQRPTMGKVVQMLEGIVETLRPPAPEAVNEGSVSGTSVNFSTYSTTGGSGSGSGSGLAPYSSSSLQAAGLSPLASGENTEKASSSLLHSFQLEIH